MKRKLNSPQPSKKLKKIPKINDVQRRKLKKVFKKKELQKLMVLAGEPVIENLDKSTMAHILSRNKKIGNLINILKIPVALTLTVLASNKIYNKYKSVVSKNTVQKNTKIITNSTQEVRDFRLEVNSQKLKDEFLDRYKNHEVRNLGEYVRNNENINATKFKIITEKLDGLYTYYNPLVIDLVSLKQILQNSDSKTILETLKTIKENNSENKHKYN